VQREARHAITIPGPNLDNLLALDTLHDV